MPNIRRKPVVYPEPRERVHSRLEETQLALAVSGKEELIDAETEIAHPEFIKRVFKRGKCRIHLGDVLDLYSTWERPTIIVSDGAYGLNSFPGDPPTVAGLEEWYRPHINAWSERALPSTTLWFWNSELGWATVHPLLLAAGWEYRNCHIWDKGIAHAAGNTNTKTIRKFPVVTEVCVQYVRKVTFRVAGGKQLPMQEWLRYEWLRAGLPLWKTNEACGVKNAATRKYFTADHLWYFPPPEAFVALARYANAHGRPEGRPYFSADGRRPLNEREWLSMRAKFQCPLGVTNVWSEPAVRGQEREKLRNACIHMNQKPLKLIERCILASSDGRDVVWEPFGGLCSATLAAHKLGRQGLAAECVPEFYQVAVRRLQNYELFPDQN
jgi:site-specific DNA-methyltransferase (adenine-specific)